MASFALPGRGDSILNDEAASRGSKSVREASAESPLDAAGLDRVGADSTLPRRSTATRGPKAAREATLAWRRTTAAATGLVDLADAATRPVDGDRSRGTAPFSGVRSSSSSLSPSEDSTSSFFRPRVGADSSEVGTSRSQSTSATSLGVPYHERALAKQPDKRFAAAAADPEASPSGVSSTNSSSSSLLQNGGSRSGEVKSLDSSQSRDPAAEDLRGHKVLKEPGFVSSPMPMSRNSTRPQLPESGMHNGSGLPGRAVGMDGKPSNEPANTLRAVRQASRSSITHGHDVTSLPRSPPQHAAAGVHGGRAASSSVEDRHTKADFSPGRVAPSDLSAPRGGASKVLSSSPVTIGGKKRYPCAFPECDKTFSTSGHAARHHRIHSGRKPYRCTFPGCNASFSRQDNSLQHYRTHVLHPKGRSAAAVASSIEGDTGDSDLRALDLDPETEASVQLGRKALQEGTAIAIVQEYVGRDGRREEAVQRTVGMPRTRRDSIRSDQESSSHMMDVDHDAPSDLAGSSHAMQHSRSGSALLNGAAYSPSRDYHPGPAHTSSQHHRLSMPQLPHLPPVAGNLFAPSASIDPPYYPGSSQYHRVDSTHRMPWSQPAAPSLPPAFHSYAAPAGSATPTPLATSRGALSTASPWPSEAEAAARLGPRSADPAASSHWRESSLNLLPSSRSREPISVSPTSSRLGHHRKCSSASSSGGATLPRSQLNSQDHDRSHHAAISTTPPLAKAMPNQTGHASGGVPMLPSLSRSSVLSSSPTIREPMPSLSSSARKMSEQRSSMRLDCPLPSLTQMPCSSDRSTSGMTPGAPMETPQPMGPIGTSPRAVSSETFHLPPLRSRLG